MVTPERLTEDQQPNLNKSCLLHRGFNYKDEFIGTVLWYEGHLTDIEIGSIPVTGPKNKDILIKEWEFRGFISTRYNRSFEDVRGDFEKYIQTILDDLKSFGWSVSSDTRGLTPLESDLFQRATITIINLERVSDTSD